MKIYKFMIAAFAATMALTSCTKDSADMNGANTQPDGTRVITVSFGQQTRTYLGGENGLTPQFEDGDMILVSNGTTTKILPIKMDKVIPTFSTILTGELTAVYPASAAVVENNVIKGVKVPAEQSGRFADANIAIAEHIMDDSEYGNNHAVFRNATAILRFYVHYSVGVERLEIESASENIATGSKTISIRADKDMLSDNVEDETLCYVALLPGEIQKLDITSYAPTQTETDGIVKKTYENIKIKAGQMASVFMPYYVNVNVAPPGAAHPYIQRWAYCNLGAFLPEEAGDYFAWGATEVAYVKPIQGGYFNFKTEKPASYTFASVWAPGEGFLECNTPYYDGDDYSKSKYSYANKVWVLEPKDDAANVAWGDRWRMPTKQEFELLIKATTQYISTEKPGCHFESNSNTLFLPAAGYGEKVLLSNHFIYGCYWTKELAKDIQQSDKIKDNAAYCLNFNMQTEGAESLQIIDKPRCTGCTIRPIYGDPVHEISGLQIDGYDEGPNL